MRRWLPALSLLEHELVHPLVVEVDSGSTSAKQASSGRVWLVRIRYGNQAVIVNTRLSQASAEHLAEQIEGILQSSLADFARGDGAMAQNVMLIDDLDGSEASETVSYTGDGQEYEIDLSEANVKKFKEALAPFLEKSRPVERQPVLMATPIRGSGSRRSRSTGSSRGTRTDLPEIRAWAESQGMRVSSRGRIKQTIVDAYDEAHK